MKQPSPKQSGQARVRRTIKGYLLDVSAAAQFLGTTDKSLRAMVARRVIPYRRLNSRIIFVKEELIQFIADLPGCRLEEAKENLNRRNLYE